MARHRPISRVLERTKDMRPVPAAAVPARRITKDTENPNRASLVTTSVRSRIDFLRLVTLASGSSLLISSSSSSSDTFSGSTASSMRVTSSVPPRSCWAVSRFMRKSSSSGVPFFSRMALTIYSCSLSIRMLMGKSHRSELRKRLKSPRYQ